MKKPTKKKTAAIIRILQELYPDAGCSLEFEFDYQLLFATRLAAQCTDARVNLITPVLFAKYPGLEDFASADINELEEIVKSSGFYRAKARDIKAAAAALLEKHGGHVPDSMELLLKLPGVGRKTANLILGDIYNKPAIVADTHCIRISNRLGLAGSKDPYKVELALKEIVPPGDQTALCHRFVEHGRALCKAKKPNCPGCLLNSLCPSFTP